MRSLDFPVHVSATLSVRTKGSMGKIIDLWGCGRDNVSVCLAWDDAVGLADALDRPSDRSLPLTMTSTDRSSCRLTVSRGGLFLTFSWADRPPVEARLEGEIAVKLAKALREGRE